ncbi:MAG: helicase-related protein [Alphaproteobacteria bacterium]
MRNERLRGIGPAARAEAAGSQLGRPGRLTAVLGPTNTGKTHFALERMLGLRSGMIGLALRLLAREVYDKIVGANGAADVALITGEERIIPAHPRYFVCTVEAMPVNLRVSFLAVDEIQLCADPERGHVFTDRLLNARGEDETMLLGAATMRAAIAKLAQQAVFVSRPRFSDLAYTGGKKLTRLPRRSAIVAFSTEDVYGLAELIRSQRGGAAVVTGALSPRTRNAQVALYQSGDVDFIIATDAIGMGLNMDVDHVAFAALEKFDGITVRPLKAEEIGQIAGRAGRYMNDGTFGVTGGADPLDDDLVAQIENHRYDPIRVLQWRNSALNFASVDTLLASLDAPVAPRGLIRARPSSDHWTLMTLAQDEDIRARCTSPAVVGRLWEVCQLPDFRKLTPDEHARLVAQIFRHLMSEHGWIPGDWIASQLARLDVVDGDVDTLSARLAQIRTWTYAAHKSGWTEDPGHWQELTRAIEDRLSDALHERLTLRFIDRRTSVLMRHLREGSYFDVTLDESGAVSLGGETIGKLEGFHFAPDPRAEGIHGRTIRAAALRGLESEIAARTWRIAHAADPEIHLSEHGQFWWAGAIVAKLTAGAHALTPRVEIVADDLLKNSARELVEARLEAWITNRIAKFLRPIVLLRDAVEARGSKALPASARGIAFQLCEALGNVDRQSATLPSDVRAAATALRPFGAHFSRRCIYFQALLKPQPAALAALLWAVHAKEARIPPPPPPGLTSFEADGDTPTAFLGAAGFRVVAGRAIRLDIVERMQGMLWQASRKATNAHEALLDLASLLGCSTDECINVARSLGWRSMQAKAESAPVWKRTRQRIGARDTAERRAVGKPHSPFAELAALIQAD